MVGNLRKETRFRDAAQPFFRIAFDAESLVHNTPVVIITKGMFAFGKPWRNHCPAAYKAVIKSFGGRRESVIAPPARLDELGCEQYDRLWFRGGRDR